MRLNQQNILFFLRATQPGGTEKVVSQLCRILAPKVNKLVICSAKGFDMQFLDDLEIKYYMLPDIETKTPKTILQVVRILTKIVREENITIIHTHHRMAAFYVAVLGLYRKSVFINTSHNTFIDKRHVTDFAYKKAHLIACGDIVKNNLVDCFGIAEERVTVIYNAVEAFDGKIVPIEELRELHRQGYTLVANIGRLSKQKGMEYFIRSLPMVWQKEEKVKYIIVGDGEEYERLERLANDIGVKDGVLFLGYRRDIQNVMAQTDFVVLSSLWEGFPLTPIEAFSVGKAVVATAVDGTIEIVGSKNGILVEPKNSLEIANAVVSLVLDIKKRRSMERAAKEAYLSKFSYNQFCRAYVDYYTHLLNI